MAKLFFIIPFYFYDYERVILTLRNGRENSTPVCSDVSYKLFSNQNDWKFQEGVSNGSIVIGGVITAHATLKPRV